MTVKVITNLHFNKTFFSSVKGYCKSLIKYLMLMIILSTCKRMMLNIYTGNIKVKIEENFQDIFLQSLEEFILETILHV